jgi:formate hydrogenlyase transcriptional activator
VQDRNSNNFREDPSHLQHPIDSSKLDEEIFGSSEMLLPALAMVPNLAATDCTVLITGEAGTGTELVAKAIHRLSNRSPREFVRVNCAAVPPQLIASEQFGRQKGSWSQATQPRPDRFQLAKGGTIFLEGLGNLSARAQLALLQFLQEIEPQPTDDELTQSNVRLIAATSRDLHAAVADGTFRSDLFDRLNGFPLKVPSLRERTEDIPMLAGYFLNRYARRAGKPLPHLSRPALHLLRSHLWPGNMRELQSVMERFVNLCETETFLVAAKGIHLESSAARTSISSISGELRPSEKEFLEHRLMECLRHSLALESESPGMVEASRIIGDSVNREVLSRCALD